MIIDRAERMVVQHLDDAAVLDTPAGALIEHAVQFALERPEPGDSLLDLREARTGDGIGRGTGLTGTFGKTEQVPDRADREAEVARVADEAQPLEVGPAIAPLVAAGTARCVDQPDLFIVADRRNLHPAAPRQLADWSGPRFAGQSAVGFRH